MRSLVFFCSNSGRVLRVCAQSMHCLTYWYVSSGDREIIDQASNVDGTPYIRVNLPLTQNPVQTTWGQNIGFRSSYVNYYVGNSVVLVPEYDDPMDAVALDIVQGLYPERTAVGINCQNMLAMGWHGALRYATAAHGCDEPFPPAPATFWGAKTRHRHLRPHGARGADARNGTPLHQALRKRHQREGIHLGIVPRWTSAGALWKGARENLRSFERAGFYICISLDLLPLLNDGVHPKPSHPQGFENTCTGSHGIHYAYPGCLGPPQPAVKVGVLPFSEAPLSSVQRSIYHLPILSVAHVDCGSEVGCER